MLTTRNLLVLFLIIIFIIILVITLIKDIMEAEKRDKKFEEFAKNHDRIMLNCNLSDTPLSEQLRYSIREDDTSKIKPIFKGRKAIVGTYQSHVIENATDILQKFGLEVDFVKSGEELVDIIKAGAKYDIIFTNHIFPTKMQGIDVLEELKSIPEFNIPIVAHTTSVGKRQEFLNAGFDEFLPKPMKSDETEKVLKKFFEKTEEKIQNKFE